MQVESLTRKVYVSHCIQYQREQWRKEGPIGFLTIQFAVYNWILYKSVWSAIVQISFKWWFAKNWWRTWPHTWFLQVYEPGFWMPRSIAINHELNRRISAHMGLENLRGLRPLLFILIKLFLNTLITIR